MNSSSSSKSRIDFWLVSNQLITYVKECSISAAPFTDHCSIDISFKPISDISRNKDYWKFNANLLFNEGFCNKIKELIQKITNDTTLSSHVNRWEYLKFKIRELSIKYSKMLAKVKSQDENTLIHQINKHCSKEVLSEEGKK